MLSEMELELVLAKAQSTGADFAELFFEDRSDTIIKGANQRVDGLTSLHIYGVGLYVLKGTVSVYVYSNDTSMNSLMNLASTAASLIPFAKEKKSEHITFTEVKHQPINPVEIYPADVEAKKKIEILKEMDLAARSSKVKTSGMRTEYYDNTQRITIVNSEGLKASDERTFTRVRLAGAVCYNDKASFSFHDFARPCGFEAFEKYDYIGFVNDTLENSERGLKATSAKSMVCPVVFGPHCGTFWHESCGHNLETTAINGCFKGKMGEMIASSKVTLIDDGTVPGLYGSEAIDDEGHVTQKNILIENGRMVSWLADRKGGRLSKMGSNGSGRRQSYCFAPVARMHNTYLAPGKEKVEDIIRSVDKGLYVESLGGGCSGNNFSVAVGYGYLIENGKLTRPVANMSLSGTSSEIIKRVDMVADDITLPVGGGFCGAGSGLCNVTDYTPTFRVSSMNVGGSEE